ncbi:hypothetical protein LZZ90_10550 [Flavobacterium sp. SM15]|uniref:hypothetical protein n=1 Tax=Flavobacterium sp. SM15 TaxID=2908005 RepID=UPI001EDA55AD|nr:hypothetical protein [Flavobacterium sp. SM15]MCG2611946.1 hypothetical protein [Flavobacterium sp. SM15]
MKRIANIGILFTSLLGYMEWGKGQNSFIYEIEYELFFKKPHLIENLTHPILLASLSGQILIIYCIVKNKKTAKSNIVGMILLSLIMLLILLAGALSSNAKMIFSTFPFLIFSAILIICIKKERFKTSL